MTWQNQVAVITGGGSGIGFALARRLAGEGMTIVLASTNADRLADSAAQLRAESAVPVLAVQCDVAVRSDIQDLVAIVKREFGQTDLLCANAGATTVGRFMDYEPADRDWAINVNLRGATNFIEAFYPDMPPMMMWRWRQATPAAIA